MVGWVVVQVGARAAWEAWYHGRQPAQPSQQGMQRQCMQSTAGWLRGTQPGSGSTSIGGSTSVGGSTGSACLHGRDLRGVDDLLASKPNAPPLQCLYG